MKRKLMAKKNLCLSVICLGIAFAFWEAGSVYGKKAESFSHTVTVMSEEDGLGEDIIKEIDNDPEQENAFAAWKEIPDSFLTAKESGRTSRADVIMLYGSSYCVLPYGKVIDKEDTTGCLIGRKIAEDLFGSRQVEGQELICGDRTLAVRGVIREPENLLLCEIPDISSNSSSDSSSDISFDRISFFAENAEDGRKTAEEFMNRYGLNVEILRFDYYQNLFWIKELIPGKWSDFSGWNKNLENQKEQKEQISRMRKSCLETEYLLLLRERNLCILLGFAGIATCLVIFVFGIRRPAKPKQK